LVGVIGALGLHALDPRRRREGRVAALGVPVLTRVPRLRRSRRGRQAFDESFRDLRTLVRLAAPGLGSIALTSTSEREGRTTATFQLAMAFLEAGESVLLVEADPYRTGLRDLLDVSDAELGGPGLLDHLAGAAPLDDVVRDGPLPGIAFVPSGSPRAQSMSTLLRSPRGQRLVRDLEGHADVVLLDCPPAGARSDALRIAAMADVAVLVVDLEEGREIDIAGAVRRLRATGANLAGVVLNRDGSTAAADDARVLDGEHPSAAGTAGASHRL
jgi:tyrosine-protein kinase Etk/Wzc